MNTPLVTATTPGNKVSLLEQLPPELLHRILEYVLPYGLTFTFEKSRPVADNSIWILFAARGKHAPRAIANKPSTIVHAPHRNRTAGYSIGQVVYGCDVCEHPYDCEYELRPEDVCTELALLYVDKAIAREARAFISSKNIFSFHITGKADHPISLRSPLAFGPLGLPHRIHLLRDLRRIELTLMVDDLTSWTRIRLRARTQYFVDILQEHAGDANKQTLLTQLEVSIAAWKSSIRCSRPRWGLGILRHKQNSDIRTVSDQLMFALEPLESLRGISDITVHGAPEWFKQCLEMRIRGEGGDLKILNWPTKTVRRQQKGSRKRVEVEVSTRQGWQPMFDWRHFAARNGISLPETFDNCFPGSQEAGEGVKVIPASPGALIAN